VDQEFKECEERLVVIADKKKISLDGLAVLVLSHAVDPAQSEAPLSLPGDSLMGQFLPDI
jgi:hypothetical protein